MAYEDGVVTVESSNHPDATFVSRYAAILPQIANLKPCALDAFLLFQVRSDQSDSCFDAPMVGSVLTHQWRQARVSAA